MKLFFAETVHAHTHTCFRAKRDGTEPFRLSICSVFKKFNFKEIIYSNTKNCFCYILVCSPPSQITNIQLVASSAMIGLRIVIAMMVRWSPIVWGPFISLSWSSGTAAACIQLLSGRGFTLTTT